MRSKKLVVFGISFGVLFLIAAVVCFIVFPILRNRVKKEPTSHYVMIDAGSSSSKIFSYSWKSSPSTASHVDENFQHRTQYGITYYASDLENAGEDLLDVISKNITGGLEPVVPSYDMNVTPVRLGATAGVRLFEARSRVSSKLLMDTLRKKLASTGLLLTDPASQVGLLTGAEEALSAWIAVNYLKDTLKRPSMRAPQAGTVGALEVGGASAQIAFVTDGSETKEVCDVTLYGNKMKVYCHSLLCFGQDTVEQQLMAKVWVASGAPTTPPAVQIDHPCYNVGYVASQPASKFLQVPCFNNTGTELPHPLDTIFSFKGTGNYIECANLTQSLFTKVINDVYQPVLPKGKFVAISALYTTAAFYKVGETKLSFSQYRQAVDAVCQTPYATLKNEHPDVPDTYLSQYCFMGVFVDKLLSHHGFTEDRWHDITFTKNINDRSVTWAIGYLLKESAGVPAGEAFYVLNKPSYTGLMVMAGIFLALALCLFGVSGCLYYR